MGGAIEKPVTKETFFEKLSSFVIQIAENQLIFVSYSERLNIPRVAYGFLSSKSD